MAVFEGQVTPSGGAPYWVSDNPVPIGTPATGRVPGTHLFVTIGGVPTQLDLATGIYLPTQMVVSDTTGAPVQIGDAANNAARVNIVGGGSVTQFGVDSSPYAVEVDGGVAPLYLTGPVTPVASGTRQAAARMSNERVMFTTGPPRENMTQGFQDLTTVGEFTILPAGDTGVFHDLTGYMDIQHKRISEV
jgi:hypothetical protein